MPHATGNDTTAAPTGQVRKSDVIYGGDGARGIAGGKQSDVCLHGAVIDRYGKFLPGKNVLDCGVGRGAFSRRLARLGPGSLRLTDYDHGAAGAVLEKLQSDSKVSTTVRLSEHQLDVTGNLRALGDEKFDFIFCLSVLMHPDLEGSQRAVKGLAAHLAPGGKLVISVICHEVALELFTPVPELGEHCFVPALAGFEVYPTSKLLLSETDLRMVEYYPPNEHYSLACTLDGCKLIRWAAVAGEECRGCCYEPVIGKPLWQMFEVTRLAQ